MLVTDFTTCRSYPSRCDVDMLRGQHSKEPA
jgi:hypothetical protein